MPYNISMNSITDLIYAFEMATNDILVTEYFDKHLSDRDLVHMARYLVNNLTDNHTMAGNDWNTMTGIIHYYHDGVANPRANSISTPQAVWLIAHIKKYLHLRKPDAVFI
jgi:hypothetical protein